MKLNKFYFYDNFILFYFYKRNWYIYNKNQEITTDWENSIKSIVYLYKMKNKLEKSNLNIELSFK